MANSSASPSSPASRLTRGYAICIVGTVIWSSTGVLIAYLTANYEIAPLVLAFWRDLAMAGFLALVFALFSSRRLRPGAGNAGFFLLYGLVLSLFNSLWTISVALNGASVSTVLAYSSTAFTALLGWRLLGESLGGLKILAVTLSILGTVLVSGAYNPANWQLNPLGIITGLFSGLAFAAYSLMGRVSSQRKIDPWTTLLYTFASAAVYILGYNLLAGWLPQGTASSDLFQLGAQWQAWAVLLFLAIGPTIGGYGLYTVSLGYLPASVANLIAATEPVFTAILAYFLLNEVLTASQLAGGALIVVSVVVVRVAESRSAPSPAPAALEQSRAA